MDEQQKKWVFVGILCVLIAGGYYWFLYKDQALAINQLEAKVQDLTQKINLARSQVAQLDDLRKEMEELEKQWEAALIYLPTHDEIEIVLRRIDDAINDSNLKSNSFAPNEPQEQDFYSTQNIGLALEGRFPDFLSFLDRLEKFDRIVHPKYISIRINRAKSDEPRKEFVMDITLSVIAYIQGEAQTS